MKNRRKISRYWLGCIAQEGLRDFHLLILSDLLVSLANISLDITKLQSLQYLLTLPLLCLITTTAAHTYTYTHKFELDTHLSYPRKTLLMNFKYLQRSICIFLLLKWDFYYIIYPGYGFTCLWFFQFLPQSLPLGSTSFLSLIKKQTVL